MSSRLFVRATLVAVALVAAGWLIAGLRATDAESEGAAIVNSPRGKISPDEVRRGLDILRDARRFNADKEPEINQVILLLSVSGSTSKALALAEQVVDEEPQNVNAWFALWAASLAAGDRARADRGISEVRRLDPLRARALERLDTQSSAGS